ncbi:WD40 repeat domain-containing protein [Botrimarina hoheduenensis]|uniref:WD40 repeat domain-containing protein n=1 Tax=Botrimarina hoheduenensis TaxID=2528000 RepID=UPI0011B7B91A|nr:hypothetical protein [Botrimarina hoheduenensis]
MAQSSREGRIQEHLRTLDSGIGHEQEAAANALLLVDPSSVDPELRKKIARTFRDKALNSHSHDKGPLIHGLVHWGGKYSTTVLIEILRSEKLRVDKEIFDALAESESTEAAEAVAALLGNFFNSDAAAQCLVQMGPIAEPVVIRAAKTAPGDMSMAAVNVLGEIGGEAGLKALRQLSGRGPVEQRSAAKLAAARVRSRLQAGDEEKDQYAEEAPPAIDPDDPFAPPANGGKGLSGHDEEGDWSQVEAPLANRPRPGSFRPDPAPKTDAKPPRFKSTRLSDLPGHGISHPIAVSMTRADPTRLAVVINDAMASRSASVQLVDASAGRVKRLQQLPPDIKHAALSPRGRRLATMAEEGRHRERMRIDIWELAHKEPKLIESWRPYHQDHREILATDPRWIAWTDEDHLLTLNRAGDLVRWKTAGAVAQTRWKIDGWSLPVMSPGGRQIAAVAPDGILVFDVESGDTLFWFEEKLERDRGLGFDPTGTKLACVEGTRIRIWDLATAETLTDFHVKDIARIGDDATKPLSFLGDERLVVRGRQAVDVVDLVQRRVLTRGEHSADYLAGCEGTTLLACVFGQTPALYAERAPDAEVAPSPRVDDPESLLAIRPGSAIALDVRVGSGLDQEVRQLLTTAITQAGHVLDPNATTKLVARQESKQEVITYKGFHTPSWVDDGKQVSVEEKIYTATLFIEGEAAWRYMAKQGAQHMLHTQQGESYQEASDRAMQANANYFRRVSVPRYLVAPQHAGPLQTVKLRGK